ncbi:MAG: type II toxin-antitoxin system VapC family toxin [Cellulomonadaceae bacterium]|jgi:predicted nucleic acid-binding protein|nr:type II toxin-antitoxin system VapC family toxin [Cellulomonadaceae bacterium]
MTVNTNKSWYLDTSVFLRALLGESPAAKEWLDSRIARRERLVSSKLLHGEAIRTVMNHELRNHRNNRRIPVDPYISSLILVRISNEIVEETGNIHYLLRTADAIHVATALRIGPEEVTIVTHDRQMARAARNLGFVVHDPVTDDPNSPPVTADW